MGWQATAPWKFQDGKTQSLAVPNAASTPFPNAVGAHTQAVLLSVLGANCTIRIGQPGVTAGANDTIVKTTDDPLVIGCAPGDMVSAYGLAASGRLLLTELTH